MVRSLPANPDFVYFCRELNQSEHFRALVAEMSGDAINRMTSANPDDVEAIRAGRYAYDAAQNLASLVHNYANVDLGKK